MSGVCSNNRHNKIINSRQTLIITIAFLFLLAIAGIGIAKYTSLGQLGQEARVAEFGISAEPGEFKEKPDATSYGELDKNNTLDYDVENDTIEYSFTFGSDSEVATVTGIQIPSLPTGFFVDLYIDGSETPCDKTIEKIIVQDDFGPQHVANKYTFSTINVFGPGQKTASAKLVFKLDLSENLIGEVTFNGIDINVLFEQID